jgi:hypothetical protein
MVDMTHTSNDQTFLNLLNTQREMLNRLTMEQHHIPRKNPGRHDHQQQMMMVAVDKHMPLKKRTSVLGSYGVIEPIDLSQQSYGRRSSLDLLFSKRFGMDVDSSPSSNGESDGDSSEDEPTISKDDLDDSIEKALKKSLKRRRDSPELTDLLLSEESSLSNFDQPLDSQYQNHGMVMRPMQPQPPAKRVKVQSFYRSLDVPLEQIKSTMEGFQSAMEKSAKSQQDIHDWDKKMGLKRSHSKRMRESSRSRKKLRALTKKEFNLLFGNKR